MNCEVRLIKFVYDNQPDICDNMYDYKEFQAKFPTFTHAIVVDGKVENVGPGLEMAQDMVYRMTPCR